VFRTKCIPVKIVGGSDVPAATPFWSSTEYLPRHGVPKAGKAIWIRTCQHIDGWTDVPKVARARIPAPAP